MSAKYTLKVVSDFASAHTLRDYPGACSRMHGHNWKVEAEVEARALDKTGMGVDFKFIRHAVRELTDQLDHRYLNEIAPFDQVNPTAENIARYIYHELKKLLKSKKVTLHKVLVQESPGSEATYYK